MTGFGTSPDQLLGHAGTLGGVADRLIDVGGRLPDGLGEASLGAFAQFLTAGLGGAMGQTRDAYTHAASAVDTMGMGLRQAADDYRRVDDDHAGTFEGGVR
ncbi:WXG100 family type VII secretion target [Actinophytocola gossypii]|uniref:ESX-1 secretion-associated protein n=1 Tax=Actinophytocola gossypii TaxID=2812003 RepID=A0ABT2J3L9_9PSEU|nr:hypothetical protein [Actinophytocola gossypii]MCT2582346.1 hypothetical protein [Actinophytocola gossypii]